MYNRGELLVSGGTNRGHIHKYQEAYVHQWTSQHQNIRHAKIVFTKIDLDRSFPVSSIIYLRHLHSVPVKKTSPQ